MTEAEAQTKRLEEAIIYMWKLKKRNKPMFVLINYTTRRKIRDILGKEVCERLGL